MHDHDDVFAAAASCCVCAHIHLHAAGSRHPLHMRGLSSVYSSRGKR